MRARRFKSAALAFAIVSFLASSALADSFTFTGGAGFGRDNSDFFLSGPSFSIRSAAPGAFAGVLFFCTQGSTCHVPGFEIGAFDSHITSPGDQSSGSVGGVTAYTLTGSLFFSGTSFTAGTDPNTFGSGPISFWGDLTGFVFLPLGCESPSNPSDSTCTDIGPRVFHIHLTGTGTVTTVGGIFGPGLDGIDQVRYNFSGIATIVPEPSSLILLGSGLAGLAGIRRWRRPDGN